MGVILGLEERRLKMFEKSFGPEWEEVTEYWRKLRSFLLILITKYLRVMLHQYQISSGNITPVPNNFG
jgi:hypothetical protein